MKAYVMIDKKQQPVEHTIRATAAEAQNALAAATGLNGQKLATLGYQALELDASPAKPKEAPTPAAASPAQPTGQTAAAK